MRRAHVRLVCTLLLLAAGLVGSAGCAGPRIVTETKIRGLGGEPCTSASENATRYDAACMSVTIDVTARPTKLTGTPTGIIDFKDGATAIGTAPLGPEGTAQATFEFFFGAHEISVVYSGDSSFAGSTSETEVVEVRNQIKIALTSSENPSARGSTVTFTATLTPTLGAGMPTGTIAFKETTYRPGGGSQTVLLGTGTLSFGQATYSTSSLSLGLHEIFAYYDGDATFEYSSSDRLVQWVI